jgi:hypothetical protein
MQILGCYTRQYLNRFFLKQKTIACGLKCIGGTCGQTNRKHNHRGSDSTTNRHALFGCGKFLALVTNFKASTLLVFFLVVSGPFNVGLFGYALANSYTW